MKLELKHIKGYLGTNLKVKRTFNNEIMFLHGISGNHTIEALDANDLEMCALLAFGNCQIDDYEAFKLILRPLSDLTKYCDDLGFVPMDKLAEIDEVVCLQYSIEFFETSTKYLPNWIIQKLYEWHFDIHGLIENNLAIDINTL